jgi:hypothetical protein
MRYVCVERIVRVCEDGEEGTSCSDVGLKVNKDAGWSGDSKRASWRENSANAG